MANFRCESARGIESSELRFTLPGDSHPGDSAPLHIAVPEGGGYGVNALTYCFNNRGFPPHLGNEIQVSAIFSSSS